MEDISFWSKLLVLVIPAGITYSVIVWITYTLGKWGDDHDHHKS